MKNLSKKATDFFAGNGVISMEQKPMFQYSLETCLHNFVTAAACLLYGFINHMLVESAVFLFVFAAIRCFAGGVHATTRLKCFLVTVAMFLCGSWMVSSLDPRVLALMAIAASGVIFRFAPLEHSLNYLSLAQKQKHRYLAVAACALFLLIATVGMQAIPSGVWSAVYAAVIMVAVFMTLSASIYKEISIRRAVKPALNMAVMAILMVGVSSVHVTCAFWGYQSEVSSDVRRYCDKNG